MILLVPWKKMKQIFLSFHVFFSMTSRICHRPQCFHVQWHTSTNYERIISENLALLLKFRKSFSHWIKLKNPRENPLYRVCKLSYKNAELLYQEVILFSKRLTFFKLIKIFSWNFFATGKKNARVHLFLKHFVKSNCQ